MNIKMISEKVVSIGSDIVKSGELSAALAIVSGIAAKTILEVHNTIDYAKPSLMGKPIYHNEQYVIFGYGLLFAGISAGFTYRTVKVLSSHILGK